MRTLLIGTAILTFILGFMQLFFAHVLDEIELKISALFKGLDDSGLPRFRLITGLIFCMCGAVLLYLALTMSIQ